MYVALTSLLPAPVRYPIALLLTLAIATITVAACAPPIRRTGDGPLTAAQLAELWVAPKDIASRDLFHGTGGRRLMPAPDTRFVVTEKDTTGFSRGYDVRDGAGRKWKIKLGEEAQPELVASRVLWAIGYHQPPLYYLPAIRYDGNVEDEGKPGRLRAEFAYDTEGDWSWHENPFVGTPQLRGLLVANLILNNWDIKPSQNRIYQMEDERARPRRRYVVQDLGASLGLTAWPTGNRNDIASFEQQRLIRKVTDQGLEFDYGARHGELLRDVTPADVVWVCKLLAQITDAQWDDAFRAADYEPELRARFIRKIKAKIQEGLDLAPHEGARR